MGWKPYWNIINENNRRRTADDKHTPLPWDFLLRGAEKEQYPGGTGPVCLCVCFKIESITDGLYSMGMAPYQNHLKTSLTCFDLYIVP